MSITLKKAREILGESSKKYSDKEVLDSIHTLEGIARLAIEAYKSDENISKK